MILYIKKDCMRKDKAGIYEHNLNRKIPRIEKKEWRKDGVYLGVSGFDMIMRSFKNILKDCFLKLIIKLSFSG